MKKTKETQAVYTPSSAPLNTPRKAAPLTRSSDVWELLKDMMALDREHFVVLHMDVRNRVIERETVAIGTLIGVESHPREVFKKAITLSAASIILAHNHPSGDPSPSAADIAITERMRQVGKIIGIEVLDHVVIGAEGYVSIAERNWQ